MYRITELPALIIGRQDDNRVKTVEIDCTPWAKANPDLTMFRVEMSIGGAKFVPMRQSYVNGVLTWEISQQDTAVAGDGRYEIVATGDNGQQQTSASAAIYVHTRITGTALGIPPDYVQPLLDKIAEMIASAGGSSVTPEQIQQAVDNYLTENPVQLDEQDPTVPDWAKQPEPPKMPDPYTLPTASADTLGGVKVGKGLQMDGDVLGVMVEQPMRLINEITVDVPVASINLTEDANGNSFAVKKAYVVVTPGAGIDDDFTGVLRKATGALLYIQSDQIKKAGASLRACISIENQRLFVDRAFVITSSGSTAFSGNVPYGRAFGVEVADAITDIGAAALNGKTWPAGTTFELYEMGVF